MRLCACGKNLEIVMNILIVDDNKESLYFLEVLLKGNGHDVRSASNGAEALERLKAGGIDLIISDILMPVMDGFQLCRKVKADKDLRHIPFIIYTSTYISPQDEAFAVKIGADRFIVKPCEPDVFMEAIQDEMAAGRCRKSTVMPEPEQEKEVLRLYNERLVQKLEQKMLQLEKEIQARYDAEETLRASERKYRLLADNILDVIWAMDRNLVFTYVNPATQWVLGYSPEEWIGSPLSKHCNEENYSKTLQVIADVMDKGPKDPDLVFETVFFNKNHEPIPFEIRGKINYDEKGNPVSLQGVARDISERRHAEEELQNAFDTIKVLKDQLEAENIYLRDEMELKDGYGDIIGTSDPMKYVMHRMRQVARTKATVLLTGETGTGKGIFARFLHRESNRRDKPFVNVPCAGLPANLIESELFGREKGAFTGSTARQIGRFELAHGGSIFLDEIGELPIELQAKLLRVIEEGEFERLGNPHPVKVDVRVIASTNRNLEEEIKNGRFRKDLFYRLNVFPVTLPPLRQRREDISLLVEFFVGRFSNSFGKRIERTPKNIMKDLEDYAWPGNVRELINVIERAVIVSNGPELRLAEKIGSSPILDHRKQTPNEAEGRKGLAEMEREHILRILKETGWKIEGPAGAAAGLRMNPSTLRARMKKLGIKRPKSPLDASFDAPVNPHYPLP